MHLFFCYHVFVRPFLLEEKTCEDLYSTLAIKEDLAKKLGLEFPIRREEGSMRAARVQPEAPAGKEAEEAAPPDADKPKKQRKKGDAVDWPTAFSKIQQLTLLLNSAVQIFIRVVKIILASESDPWFIGF